MGKLTKEQEQALAELTALRDAPDDDADFDIILEQDGKRMTVPWSRAAKWRSAFGLDDDPAGEAGEGQGEGGEGQGEGQGEKKDPPPPSNHRYFR